MADREAMERAVIGALKSAITDHGPITKDRITSAVKRVIGNLANAGVGGPSTHEDLAAPGGRVLPAFLAEIWAVCEKHGLALSHEDIHGRFEVVQIDSYHKQWLMDARDATERRVLENRVYVSAEPVQCTCGRGSMGFPHTISCPLAGTDERLQPDVVPGGSVRAVTPSGPVSLCAHDQLRALGVREIEVIGLMRPQDRALIVEAAAALRAAVTAARDDFEGITDAAAANLGRDFKAWEVTLAKLDEAAK